MVEKFRINFDIEKNGDLHQAINQVKTIFEYPSLSSTARFLIKFAAGELTNEKMLKLLKNEKLRYAAKNKQLP
jgi:hypothetical protein